MTEQSLFNDLLVIDCASFIAGPAAGTILSDFGAQVIKIEPPTGEASLPRFRVRLTWPSAITGQRHKKTTRPGGRVVLCFYVQSAGQIVEHQ